MATYDELRAAAEPIWSAVEKPQRTLFVVSLNTSSIASGAEQTLAALRALGEKQGFDVGITGDTGLSWAEPVVQARRPGAPTVLYRNITADKCESFASTAANGIATEEAIGIVDGAGSGDTPLAEIEWMRPQVRWMMHNCGVIDPTNIDHYIGRGGYGNYMKAAAMSRDDLIALVTGSTLRGHSGSFFSTGTKWKFLKDATREPKYLVCNADEGDPGAWVNRVLMESDPHLILEGMLMAAYASGANYGWIYIRDEYPLAVERMNRALEQCRERGIYGDNALGTGVKYDAEVIRGAGAYVCGDETGLIASVNDGRGMPKIKPPFPAQSGVLGMPTNVNNVETYAAAATLLRVGAEEYSTVGTELNRGTKMVTVSGACEKSGCMEVPFGTTLGTLLEAAGGIADGRAWKGVQPGGPLSGLLPADICRDLGIEFETFRAIGAGAGGGGYVYFDDRACVVDLNVMFSWFLEDESCGRCTTCRGGNQRMLEIFKRTSRGEAEAEDIPRLQSLDASMQYSNCFHGTLSPVIMRNTLKYFREEYDQHALHHKCPAKVCAGLIRYRVANQSAAVADAADICPTNAIVKDAAGRWTIDDAKCIRCNACVERSPSAIVIEDRYADTIPLQPVMRANVAPAQVPVLPRP